MNSNNIVDVSLDENGREQKDAATVILHIGMSKTATTAVQRLLYENSTMLKSTGINYPSNFRDVDRGYSDWGHHILSHKWGGWLSPSVFPISPDEAWEHTAAEIKSSRETFIISSERFQDLLVMDNYREILEFIRDIVAPATLKIVGYVRRQDDFAESHYKELVKNGFNKESLDSYLGNLPSFYDYSRYFDRCAEVVGKDNIVVRIFDKDYFVGGSVFSDFFYACGFLMPEEVVVSEDITNPSLSSSLAYVMGDPSVKPFWKDRGFRSQMFSIFDKRSGIPSDKLPLINQSKRNEIIRSFQESNEKLVADYLGSEYSTVFDSVIDDAKSSFNDERLIFSSKEVRAILSEAADVWRRVGVK